MREPMLNNKGFQDNIYRLIEKNLDELAEEKIQELTQAFQEDLRKNKHDIIGRIVRAIDIFTDYDMPGQQYNIHVRFSKNDEI